MTGMADTLMTVKMIVIMQSSVDNKERPNILSSSPIVRDPLKHLYTFQHAITKMPAKIAKPESP